MKMNKFEVFACSQIFHSFPEDKTFHEIKLLCLDDDARDAFNESLEDTDREDQQLQVCERYEMEWWENLPILLDDLKVSAENHFGDNAK